MSGERNLGERMAVLETDLRSVRERVLEIEAGQKETVKEFREALDRHRDNHSRDAKQAADTRWKFMTALLAIAAVVGPIATAILTKK